MARKLAILILVALLLAIGGLAWWLSQPAALRWGLDRAVAASGGRLQLAQIEGNLLQGLHIGRLQWRDPASAGLELDLSELRLRWRPLSLLHGQIDLDDLSAASVRIVLAPSDDLPVVLPSSFALPVGVRLRSLRVDRLSVVAADGGEPVLLKQVELEAGYRRGRFLVSRLEADTPWGHAHIDGQLLDRAPFEADLNAAFALTAAPAPVTIEARARGPLTALEVQARAQAGASGSVKAQGQLRPFETPAFGAVSLTLDGVDLASLGLLEGHATRLSGHGEIRPVAPAQGTVQAALELTGRIEIDNALAGPYDQGALPLTSLRSALRWSSANGLTLSDAELRLSGDGRIAGDVRLDPSRHLILPGVQLPWLALDLRIAGVNLAAMHGQLPETQLKGQARSDGQDFRLQVDDAARSGISLQARGRVDRRSLSIERAELASGEALGRMRLLAAGQLGAVTPHAIALAGSFERLDPSRLKALAALFASAAPAKPAAGAAAGTAAAHPDTLAALSGMLDGDWSLRGSLPATGPTGDLRAALKVTQGRLSGMPAGGRVSARVLGVAADAAPLERLRVRDAEIDLTLGSASLKANGNLGAASDRLAFQLRAPALQLFALLAGQPDLAGALRADGRLGGSMARPVLDLHAEGRRLTVDGSLTADRIDLDLSLPPAVGGATRTLFEAKLSAQELAAGPLLLRRLSIDADGGLRSHRLRASLDSGQAQLQIAANGGFADDWRWSGMLNRVDLGGRLRAKLAAPVAIEIDPGASGFAVQAGAATLEGDFGALRLQRADWRAGLIDLAMQAELSRLGSLAAVFGLTSDVAGATETLDAMTLALRADLSGRTLDDLSGRLVARLESPPGAVGSGSAELSLDKGALSGPLRLTMPTLAFANRLIGPEWVVDGRLSFDGRVSGRLAAPLLIGSVQGSGLRLQQQAMGWRMRDGSLSGRFDGERFRLDSLRLYAGAKEAPGWVELSGQVRVADLEGQFDLTANRFGVLIGPGQRVVVSGTAQASSKAGAFRLTGKLRVDEGRVELAGGDAPTLPDDVIVLSSGRAAAPTPAEPVAGAASLKIAADLELDLGDNLRVLGSGLDARLAGVVKLQGTLPAAPRAYGTVRVRDGRFSAYGQALAITRGLIVFNGSIENPVLDIVALRRNQQVEAGVAVTGTVLSPQIRLTSRPEVSDAEKLSWLVLGVPLENAQSAGQGAALQLAAATLFGSNDGGLANALGLDVLTIRSSSGSGEGLLSSRFGGGGLGTALPPVPGQVGSTGGGVAYAGAAENVVALGKRLNSRLMVTYEQGLRGVWNLLLIQYDITRRLSLRAQTGSESAIDLVYRFSFDELPWRQ